MNGKYPHFAIPEIYGETLSYYELLRKLVKAMNVMIENYDTIPDQIAEAVANLDASQLFSAVLNQLIESIATDNTKSANAVKVYKKHDLLYATFNETVNLYESLIDFTTGTETELIIGTNIREVNISELFIELRELIEDEAQERRQGNTTLQNNINNESQARKQADQLLQTNIDNEAQTREQADQNLQKKIDDGTLKVDLLWTNASTTTEFSKQDVSLDLSNYKMIVLLLKFSTTVGAFIGWVGKKNSTISCTLANPTIKYRSIIASDTSVSIENCYNSSAYGSETINNTFLIPYQIYGVR